MEKAKRREKKWKYMLHDPRIGNPTYPRAARGEDKEGREREKKKKKIHFSSHPGAAPTLSLSLSLRFQPPWQPPSLPLCLFRRSV